jgi:transposase-like protein
MGRRTATATRRPETRERGRPTLLTPERRARFLEIVEEGNHLNTACAVVGIGTSTLYRWLEQADEAEAQLDAHQDDPEEAEPLTPTQQRYLDFRDALRLARARAEMTAVDVIQKSMRGGQVTSERPMLNLAGEVLRDDDGRILYERTFTAPDGRLAMNYLARSSPGAWGQNPTLSVELTGPGMAGSAESGEVSGDQVKDLARQLAVVRARKDEDSERERLELESGAFEDVQDAEIVEESE